MQPMSATNMAESNTILTLSHEIWDNIFAHLDKKSILQVAATSKKLVSCAILNLYNDIVFKIPQGSGCEQELVRFLGCGNNGLCYIRILSAINSFDRPDLEETTGEDQGLNRGGTSPLNRAMLGLIGRIPANSVTKFRWIHRFPLAIVTLSALLVNHPSTLLELTVYDLDEDAGPTFTLPTGEMNLQKLDFRSVSKIYREELFNLPYTNRKTLNSLVVGSETRLFKCYTLVHTLWLDSMSVSLEKLLCANDPNNDASYPLLQELHVISMDLMELTAKPTFVQFGNLRRLALESCQGSEKLLRGLMRDHVLNSTGSTNFLNLKEFVFRHEQITETLCGALNQFLSSFSGLELVSILLENVDEGPEDPMAFLEQHGPTLQVLIYEARRAPRRTLGEDTSLSLGDIDDPSSPISEIFSQCPKLRELSIPIDWDKNDVFGNLWKLKPDVLSLRTFHIRNLPPWRRAMLNTAEPFFVLHKNLEGMLDNALSSYRVWNTSDPDDEPKLALLALGPTTYLQARGIQHHECPEVLGSRDDMGVLAHQHPYECPQFYKQVQFYLPSVAIDRRGIERVMVAEFGDRRLDLAMEEFPMGEYRCFKTYWLE